LDHSRITTGKLTLRKEITDLNAIVRLASSTCLPQIQEKQLEFTLHLDASAGNVNGDPARLQQVVWNLLKNAAKFTPANGRVTLLTRRMDRDRVEIEIKDSGLGIEATALPRIFDAFEQADRKIMRQFGGLGLGLAISRAVIEQHGGSIRAESGGCGMGSTFRIALPSADSVHPDSSNAGKNPGETPPRPLHLLLVEDHPDTAAMLARLLRNSGYLVTVAGTAAQALDLAGQEHFDILVSDLGLPDASGCDLMRELLACHRMRGIAMSGYGMDEDFRKSMDAGFSQHLVKPVSALQIEQAIQRICGS
ncbi:MAG: hybrid sensor histidine kinase/response regulator, partial [Chthoniobacterales bacterium]